MSKQQAKEGRMEGDIKTLGQHGDSAHQVQYISKERAQQFWSKIRDTLMLIVLVLVLPHTIIDSSCRAPDGYRPHTPIRRHGSGAVDISK